MSNNEELLFPRSSHALKSLGEWLRGTLSAIATDVTQAILDDFPELDRIPYTPNMVSPSNSPVDVSLMGATPNSPDIISLLSVDSTYLVDPCAPDDEDFDSYLVGPNDANVLLQQFPSLRMRIQHYKMTSMAAEEERIMKRVLFKLHKLRSESVPTSEELVVVEKSNGVLVEGSDNDSDNFVEDTVQYISPSRNRLSI